MRFSRLLIISAVVTSLHAEAQFWGYGLQGGLSGCGYEVSQGEEASSYKDEIAELKKEISEWNKELGTLKRQLSAEKNALRKHDTVLRRNFDSEAYSFIKSHFDGQNRCSEYKGQEKPAPRGRSTTVQVGGAVKETKVESESKLPPETQSEFQQLKKANPVRTVPTTLLMRIVQSRSPAGHSDEDENEEDADLVVEPEKLAREWRTVCDIDRDPKGTLKAALCEKRYLIGGLKFNLSDCKTAVLNYPKAVRHIRNLEKEIEIKADAIKAAKAQIPELQKSMREEMLEARRQRIEEIREGGVCVECLGSVSGGSSENREPNWGGVIGNSLMAIMAYKSTSSFYGKMQDKNANLGFPTQMPMGSPWMAAAPHIMGVVGAGLGQGGFGCSGMAGGIGGMGGPMGPYAALGGMGQIGGAFGTPPWALAGQMGGGMYNQGAAPWGINGPWGLNSTGLGLYPQLMASGQLGFGLPGMAGAMGGIDPMALALLGQGAGGLAGLGGLGGLAGGGGSLMNPYAALGGYPYGIVGGAGIPGIMGMGGAGGLAGLGGLAGGLGGLGGIGGGLGGLDGGIAGLGGLGGAGGLQMQQQMMQMQLQQQQQMMQQQMRYYENAMQKQKAVSGLQSELMGVIQRIQSVQYGFNSGSTGNAYLGGNYQFGVPSGGAGGLPGSVAAPPPLNNTR